MTTTDSNGLVRFTVEDPVTPLQTALNLITASVSNFINDTVTFENVPSISARDTLATNNPPTAAKPLLVWVQSTPGFWLNKGTGWVSWPEIPEVVIPGPNTLTINGTNYIKSGTFSGIPASPAFTSFGNGVVYARTLQMTAPYTPPSDWYFHVWAAVTTGHTIVTNASTALVGGKIKMRHIQIGHSSTTALSVIGWELRKTGKSQ